MAADATAAPADADLLVQHRRLLFGIAYRITGSAADADELVQEAYLRYLRTDESVIREPVGLLVTTVTRLAIDRLRLARTQREVYVGPWLPEPILTDEALPPDAAAEQRESLSIAFLTLLERLSPPERAVFVLREAFEFPYREIADIVGLEEANCRQLHRRASTRIREDRRRFAGDTARARELLDRFLIAAVGEGTESLEQLLAEDVCAWGDGGGKASALRTPLGGRDRVARFVRGLVRTAPAGFGVDIADVNGRPALLLTDAEGLMGVYQLDGDEAGRVVRLSAVRNPDKLSRLASRLGLGLSSHGRLR